jgi:hypothetical protein
MQSLGDTKSRSWQWGGGSRRVGSLIPRYLLRVLIRQKPELWDQAESRVLARDHSTASCFSEPLAE